jgi:hypothetical protein
VLTSDPPLPSALLPLRSASLQLKELLVQEDAEHRTVEQKLRESTSYVTWEVVLDCFEMDSQMFESESLSGGFRISVLGF